MRTTDALPVATTARLPTCLALFLLPNIPKPVDISQDSLSNITDTSNISNTPDLLSSDDEDINNIPENIDKLVSCEHALMPLLPVDLGHIIDSFNSFNFVPVVSDPNRNKGNFVVMPLLNA